MQLDEAPTAASLTAALRAVQRLPSGRVARVRRLRQPAGTASLTRLTVTYSTDAAGSPPRRLLLKSARDESEARFYANLAGRTPGLAPECFLSQPAGAASRVLLADLGATHRVAGRIVDRATTAGVTARLSDLHAAWWGRRPPVAGADVLAFLEAAARAAWPVFKKAERPPRGTVSIYDRLLARGLPAGRQPLTVVHGDVHPWNVLLPRAAGEVVLVDWAAWRLDSGPSDLAYMRMTGWPGVDLELLRSYHAGLGERGVGGYGWERCLLDHRRALVANLLWPLFWWSREDPPGAVARKAMEAALSGFAELGCEELL